MNINVSEIESVCSKYQGCDTRYYVGDIPARIADSARCRQKIDESELIVAVIDFGYTNGPRDALVITDQGITWWMLDHPERISWEELASTRFQQETGNYPNSIRFNDGRAIFLFTEELGSSQNDTALRLLRDLQSVACDSKGQTPADSGGRVTSLNSESETNEADLGERHSLCPSCDSGNWKSAKLVILENTTNIEGGTRGNVRDPGMFSSGVREFFLSERWFSWDNPIELHVELTSKTKLVDEVKNFMLSFSDRLGAPPSRPVGPDKTKHFRGYEKPSRVRLSDPPKIPEPPVRPDPPTRRTFWQHIRDLWTLTIGGLSLGLIVVVVSWFLVDITMEAAVIILAAGLVFGFISYKDLPKTTYEDKLQKYEELQEEYLEAKQAVQDRPTRIARAEEEFQKAQARYLRRLAEYDAAVHRYHCEQVEYEERVVRIEALREMVWKSARVCMRCGKCYLGEPIR